MNITVLEQIPFSKNQQKRLAALGEVAYYHYGEDIPQDIALEKISGSDVVIVNWIDPSPFLLSMKPNSLVALMSTGYGWIQHLDIARKKGVLVSNIPAYATEAVAEHIFGLLLSFNKRIALGSNWSKKTDKNPCLIGTEVKGKTIGIIGLGNIGTRVFELAKAFGMECLTYNRHTKNVIGIKDVSLKVLLSNSNVVCVTATLNDESKKLINRNNLSFVKTGTIFTGATWGIIDEEALKEKLDSGVIGGVAFDLALEGSEKLLNKELLNYQNFYCTFHNAFNTVEAANRQREICIDNIENFIKNIEKNIIN